MTIRDRTADLYRALSESEDRSRGFFDRKCAADLIALASEDNRLTIFAGAGVLNDRGAPDWAQLTRRLIAGRLHEDAHGGSLEELYGQSLAGDVSEVVAEADIEAQAFVASVGPLCAASVALQKLADDKEALAERLRYCIYHNIAPRGPLTDMIASLASFAHEQEHDVVLLTTNYDVALEESGNALAGELGDPAVRFVSYTSRPPDGPRDHVPVVHLHGIVERDGTHRGLRFTEADLFVLARNSWQLTFLQDRLRDSTTVFVGTSLSDPTVVRSLVLTLDAEPLRIVLQPRQGDPWRLRDFEGVRPPDDDALERLLCARLEHLGVVPARMDFYRQAAQFLNEMRVWKQLGRAYVLESGFATDYSRRLREWWERWSALSADEQVSFSVVQDWAQDLLATLRARVADVVHARAARLALEEETLKVEVWVRREPDNRKLALWASSDASWRVDRSWHESPIEPESQYVAVRTFCEGGVLRLRAPENAIGRWQTFVSALVALEGEQWRLLPVGVISVVSAADAQESALWRMTREDLEAIGDELVVIGRVLLDPDLAAQSLQQFVRR